MVHFVVFVEVLGVFVGFGAVGFEAGVSELFGF